MPALLASIASFRPSQGPCYRLFFGYRIGKRVRIGLSIIDAGECEIADDVRIGHLNVVIGVGSFSVGDHARIGHLNLIRGGEEVRLGRYSEIIRLNEINSIPNPVVVNPVEPRFTLGEGSVITAATKLTSPTASKSGAGRSSGGAIRASGRTTGSARAPFSSGRAPTSAPRFALRREA